MSKKNKIYWFEGVTEKGVKSLLTDENSKYRWLRPQRNRRVLVTLMVVGLIAVAMGSYWPTLKTNMNLSSGAEIIIYSVTAIFVIFAVVVGYLFLRISVRGIGDAPDELLDERQIKVRDTSFRYAYYAMGYLIAGLLILMLSGPELKLFEPDGNDGSYVIIAVLFAFSSMPSMVLAWRERDI
jgi:Kef-type K+ transport system membrane component KefB